MTDVHKLEIPSRAFERRVEQALANGTILLKSNRKVFYTGWGRKCSSRWLDAPPNAKPLVKCLVKIGLKS